MGMFEFCVNDWLGWMDDYFVSTKTTYDTIITNGKECCKDDKCCCQHEKSHGEEHDCCKKSVNNKYNKPYKFDNDLFNNSVKNINNINNVYFKKYNCWTRVDDELVYVVDVPNADITFNDQTINVKYEKIIDTNYKYSKESLITVLTYPEETIKESLKVKLEDNKVVLSLKLKISER